MGEPSRAHKAGREGTSLAGSAWEETMGPRFASPSPGSDPLNASKDKNEMLRQGRAELLKLNLHRGFPMFQQLHFL